MTQLPFRAFDADNHYYEAEDAFTRHLDPQHAPARDAVGRRSTARKRLLVGGKVNRFIPNPTFDPGREARLPRRVLPRPEPRAARTSATLFGELEPIIPRTATATRGSR